MLNRAIITGRLTEDVELRKTNSGVSVASFTVAVTRDTKNSAGEYDTDFIDCVAWRQSADFLGQYGKKGDTWTVEGRLQKRRYENNGHNFTITEIVADHVYKNTSKQRVIPDAPKNNESASTFDMNAEMIDDERLPF